MQRAGRGGRKPTPIGEGLARRLLARALTGLRILQGIHLDQILGCSQLK